MKHRFFQGGNVLFLILIAVALFAALSYAVTQSSNSAGNNASAEQAEVAAGQLIQYANLIRFGVQRLQISNGCSDTEISFQRDWDGDGTIEDNNDDAFNPFSPTDNRCHIFDPAGANISYVAPDNVLLNDELEGMNLFFGDYEITGIAHIVEVGTDCMDARCAELLLLLRNLDPIVCDAINEELEIIGTIGAGITNLGSGPQRFRGFYNYTNSGSLLNVPQWIGRPIGCHLRSSAGLGLNTFHFTLIAR